MTIIRNASTLVLVCLVLIGAFATGVRYGRHNAGPSVLSVSCGDANGITTTDADTGITTTVATDTGATPL